MKNLGSQKTLNYVVKRGFFFKRVERQLNYYEILESKPEDEIEKIKERYYSLAKKYHPDVNTEPDAEVKAQ